LKAFGLVIAALLHYLKFAFAMVALGTVLGALGNLLGMVLLYHQFFRFPSCTQMDQSLFLWLAGHRGGGGQAFCAVRRDGATSGGSDA
jgi:hypothetical protein